MPPLEPEYPRQRPVLQKQAVPDFFASDEGEGLDEIKLRAERLRSHPLNTPLRPKSFYPAANFLLLCLIASYFSWTSASPMEFAANRQLSLEQGEYWRLFTSLLIHADIGHLLANSGLFLVFGLYLRNYFGFLAFPILPIIFGMLTFSIVLSHYPEQQYLVGASGMVYFMAAFWISLFVRYADYLSPLQRGMRSLAFVLVVLFPSQILPEVSYEAHALGFVFGIGCGVLLGPWLKPVAGRKAGELGQSYEEAEPKYSTTEIEEDLLP